MQSVSWDGLDWFYSFHTFDILELESSMKEDFPSVFNPKFQRNGFQCIRILTEKY